MEYLKEKILLLLLAGFTLGFCYTPQQQWRVVKTVSKDWKRFKREELQKEVNRLYRFKFISKEKSEDGSVVVEITEKGKLKIINQQLENIKNKGKSWDGRWRILFYDVPENYRKTRNALRRRFKRVGFYEIQRSVFVTPFDCIQELEAFVKFFNLKKYVRYGVLDSIDNEEFLREIFKKYIS